MNKISGQMILGIIIIAIGVLFLFDINVFGLIGKLWPFLLVVFGLYLIFAHRGKSDRVEHTADGRVKNGQSGIPGLIGDIRVAGLSDGVGTIERKLLIGDIVIDLVDSKLLDGVNVIDVALLFGDVTIILPEDYPVKIDIAACVGDLEYKGKRADGFFPSIKESDEAYDRSSSRLHILGKICFGDIKVFTNSK